MKDGPGFSLSGNSVEIEATTNFDGILSRAGRKLRQFAKLQKGWAYGRGKKISTGNLSEAFKILQMIRSLPYDATDAFPGEDGEVEITAYCGERTVSVLFDGESRSARLETDEEDVYFNDKASNGDLYQLLFNVVKQCDTSGSPAQSITSKEKGVSVDSLSQILASTNARLSFNAPAYVPAMSGYAVTFGSITPTTFQAIQQFSRYSTKAISPPALHLQKFRVSAETPVTSTLAESVATSSEN